MICKNYN